ncbi:shikimate dehydrogenase [Roseibium polysiphoniae]|uniref:shikimate dehydrogenase n=1 Tax=Roseibium polysiphoniae TaxID=2571221 RepID=UPI002599C1A5|nr:shikimate dehydrogenase [uncultured Roseibium sp.]
MSNPPKAAITGWPVTYSRSPLVHGHWLKKYGLEGDYGRRDVDPETAEDFYRNFKDSGLVGCNVTVPHKELAASVCAELDPAAEAMGAANTLWIDDSGKLCGANTDGIGFLGNLDQLAPGWDDNPGTAIVLGAGGAARAVIWSLLSRKFETVHIFNRTAEKAMEMAEKFGSSTIGHSWDELGDYIGKADLLINTTSLGMKGKAPLEIDLGPLPESALVSDIVYVPMKTDLLKKAEARGNRTVDGLGMLLHQAVPAFERWFGMRPEVDEELRAMMIADLEKDG